jgi:hypothetical protein
MIYIILAIFCRSYTAQVSDKQQPVFTQSRANWRVSTEEAHTYMLYNKVFPVEPPGQARAY